VRTGEDSLFRAIFGESVYEWLALVVLIGVSVWLVVRIKARFQDRDDPDAIGQQFMAGIGETYREGDLSDVEYRSIKRRLIERSDGSSRAND